MTDEKKEPVVPVTDETKPPEPERKRWWLKRGETRPQRARIT